MSTLVITRNPIITCANYIKDPEALDVVLTDLPEVRKLIFCWWSWKVPDTMLEQYDCYGFHTGPLLEGRGRGGSPIQNLQKLGVKITTLCAFKMNSEFDKGPIKLAVPISLEGTMDDIVYRFNQLMPPMIEYLTAEQPYIPEVFKRLKG